MLLVAVNGFFDKDWANAVNWTDSAATPDWVIPQWIDGNP